MPEEALDARIARKIKMAKEKGSRVVLVRTPEAHMILDIVRFADKGIRNLRNRLLLTLKPEEVLPLLEEYRDAVIRLNEAAQAICYKAGIPYDPPSKTLKAILEGNGAAALEKEEGDGDKGSGSSA